MYQAQIFFVNGSIFRTSPDALFKVQHFARTFEKRDDVVDIQFFDLDKDVAQAQFRTDAETWRLLAESGRKAPAYDAAKDHVAVKNYHALMAVGHSG